MQAPAYVIEVGDVMASWYRNLKAMPVTAFSFCAFPSLLSGFLRQRLSFWYLSKFSFSVPSRLRTYQDLVNNMNVISKNTSHR